MEKISGPEVKEWVLYLLPVIIASRRKADPLYGSLPYLENEYRSLNEVLGRLTAGELYHYISNIVEGYAFSIPAYDASYYEHINYIEKVLWKNRFGENDEDSIVFLQSVSKYLCNYFNDPLLTLLQTSNSVAEGRELLSLIK